MRRLILGNLLVLFASLFLFNSCKPKEPNKLPMKTVNVVYTPTDDKFPNPERGFYKYTRIDLTTGSGALSNTQLLGYRQNNITLVNRMFYLKKFKNSPLTQEALDEVEKDFETARNGGVKVIVRFAYSEQENEPDAPLDIVLQHLDQLKPVFERNADVIATVQAGFIGAWGEWYYSTNGLNTSGARYEVLKKLLEVLPKNRVVQVRTPAYKQEYFKRATALSYEEAFQGTDISRVGYHNDCFLASTTDYGTYINPVVEKAFLNRECLFVPIGGETCPPDGVSPASSTEAQSEMRYLRWSYLNDDYYKGVNDLWITQGGMDNIIKEMGYRLQLISGEYTNKVKPGGVFYARILIKNTGYAPLFNPRLVELVLKNKQSEEVFKIKLDIEPRFWQPLQTNEIEVNAGIDRNMPTGNYELYINLPDPEPTLYGNPHYSVRLANENTWEELTGYNALNVEINVSPKNNTENYSGNIFFEEEIKQ